MRQLENKLEKVQESIKHLKRTIINTISIYSDTVKVFESSNQFKVNDILVIEDNLVYLHAYKLTASHRDVLLLEHLSKSLQVLITMEDELIDSLNEEVITDLVNDMFS